MQFLKEIIIVLTTLLIICIAAGLMIIFLLLYIAFEITGWQFILIFISIIVTIGIYLYKLHNKIEGIDHENYKKK